MKYDVLLDLHVTHPYYADSRCVDFEWYPTRRTSQKLLRRRVLFRAKPDGFFLLAPPSTDGNHPLTGELIQFESWLRNPSFGRFTTVEPTGERWYVPDDGAERIAHHLRQMSNDEISAIKKAEDKAIREGEMRLSALDRASANAFGVFRLDLRTGMSLAAPPRYELPFGASLARWAYYIVTGEPYDVFAIIGDKTEPTFSEANKTYLNEATTADDAVARLLARRHPNPPGDGKRRYHLWRFVSDKPVAAQERHVAHLRLVANRGDNGQHAENQISLPPPPLNQIVQFGSRPAELTRYAIIHAS